MLLKIGINGTGSQFQLDSGYFVIVKGLKMAGAGLLIGHFGIQKAYNS
jgi:hypothetical protein